MSEHTPTSAPDRHQDIVYPAAVPFVIAHLVCFAAIWTGVTPAALWVCLALYWVRMFAVTLGYHRYFSHRSFKTSRVGQFLLAVAAMSSAQRGAVWWAGVHRAHHKYSDTPEDVHSPVVQGFWFSHVGWIFSKEKQRSDYTLVSDLTRYPELMWLDKHRYSPAIALGVIVWLLGGWTGLIVGFFWSTVLLYHGSFLINSVAHTTGSQRYLTGDHSRNNWLLALVTMGEGWHNNHHHYQSSARQGFHWWEIDMTYYGLRLLGVLRLVWDIREPPPNVVRGERRLRRAVVEQVAQQLAESFPLDRISAQVRDAWRHTVDIEGLRDRARKAREQVNTIIAEMHLPELPSLQELEARSREMFSPTHSVQEIVERAREIIIEAVSVRILDDGLGFAPAASS